MLPQSLPHLLLPLLLLLVALPTTPQAFLLPSPSSSSSRPLLLLSPLAATPTISLPPTTDRTTLIPSLLEWCSKNGINKKDLKVSIAPASNPSTGLGWVATGNIKRGEALATIPLALCLSLDSVRTSPLGRAIGSFEPALGDASLIALQLLYEASQGEKSKYATYIQTLPQPGQDGFDHPLFWSEPEKEVLAISSTRNVKQSLLDAVAADYAWIQANILAKGAVAGLAADSFDLSMFQWAVAVVLSRSFYAENGLRLAPFLDMANRGDGCQNEPEASGLGIFGGKGLKVLADRDYKQGEEVFISYGPKSGIEFLEDHGFVPAPLAGANPLEGGLCELAFEIKEGEDRFFDDKEDVLTTLQLPMRQSFDVASDGDIDPGMLQFLRFLKLDNKDAFLLEAVFRQDVWRFMELPVSEENEQGVDQVVIDACVAALAGFGVAEGETEKVLGGVGGEEKEVVGRRMEYLRRIREGEKGALEAAKAWAERDLMTSDIKVYYQERRLEELQLSGPLNDDEMPDAGGAGRSSRSLDW